MVRKMVVVDAACERVKFVLPIMTYAKPPMETSPGLVAATFSSKRLAGKYQFGALQSAR
jgi:hypothetical protein